LGKPASLHATTAFLASNVYAGQHPKPQHRLPNQGNTIPLYSLLFWLVLLGKDPIRGAMPRGDTFLGGGTFGQKKE